MGEVPVLEEERARREACVLRYKEKRQNRLFSKKIRYQVRKLNADKRPRIKVTLFFLKKNSCFFSCHWVWSFCFVMKSAFSDIFVCRVALWRDSEVARERSPKPKNISHKYLGPFPVHLFLINFNSKTFLYLSIQIILHVL